MYSHIPDSVPDSTAVEELPCDLLRQVSSLGKNVLEGELGKRFGGTKGIPKFPFGDFAVPARGHVGLDLWSRFWLDSRDGGFRSLLYRLDIYLSGMIFSCKIHQLLTCVGFSPHGSSHISSS
jgi:hypothetical protein